MHFFLALPGLKPGARRSENERRVLLTAARGCENQRQRQDNRVLAHAARRVKNIRVCTNHRRTFHEDHSDRHPRVGKTP